MRLKIDFFRIVDTFPKLPLQKIFWQCFFVKLWPLFSCKFGVATTKKSKYSKYSKDFLKLWSLISLNQKDFSKNEKNPSVLGSKERKTLLMQLKIFLRKVDTYLILSVQTIWKEMFCSQTVTLDPPQTVILAKMKKHEYFED